jgi:hypothetical protein
MGGAGKRGFGQGLLGQGLGLGAWAPGVPRSPLAGRLRWRTHSKPAVTASQVPALPRPCTPTHLQPAVLEAQPLQLAGCRVVFGLSLRRLVFLLLAVPVLRPAVQQYSSAANKR